MAIYHLSISNGSRLPRRKAAESAEARGADARGQSAVAKASYVLRLGNYSDRLDLAASGSGNLPTWAADASAFWSAVDAHSRANARLFTEVEAALPRELDQAAQLELVREFARKLADRPEGQVPYTWGIHANDGNPHVHLVLSSRADDGIERDGPKAWFARAANSTGKHQAEPGKGGVRSWSEATSKEWVSVVRESWADMVNAALAKAGSDARIDHRSHAARGLEELPTVHVGFGRGADERKARNAEAQAINEDIRALLVERAQAQAREKIEEATALARRKTQAQQDLERLPAAHAELDRAVRELTKERQGLKLKREQAMPRAQVVEAQDQLEALHEKAAVTRHLVREIHDKLEKQQRWWQWFTRRALERELLTMEPVADRALKAYQEVRSVARAPILEDLDKRDRELRQELAQRQAQREALELVGEKARQALGMGGEMNGPEAPGRGPGKGLNLRH